MLLVLAQHRDFQRRHHLESARMSGSRSRFAKREISFSASTWRNRYRHRLLSALCSTFFMPRCNRVGPSWNAFYSKASVFSAHRKEWMLQDANIRLHPWMLVTFHGNQYFGTIERLFYRRCANPLALIPLRIVGRLRVNIVLGRIAICNIQLLSSHNSQDVRPIVASVLIKRDRCCRRCPAVVANLGSVRERSVFD